MKVHLVDGTFELFRCFYGAPRATSPSGREVGAVRGLLQTLAALLRGPDVTHVAVAVDQAAAIPVREGEDPGVTAQHGLAAEAIRALGLVIWPMVKRYQADDALATAAVRWKDAPGVEQVVICTPDKDLAQCVSGSKVVLLDRIRARTTDEAGVLERYGVEPRSIPDFLALAGDAVDGLPGLPGFGPKSAGTLLRRYIRIEEIPGDASVWDVDVRGKERLARTLRERMKEALLYRELTTLALDVPLVETFADLEWKGAPRAALEVFCDEIGDRSVLDRIPRWL